MGKLWGQVLILKIEPNELDITREHHNGVMLKMQE